MNLRIILLMDEFKNWNKKDLVDSPFLLPVNEFKRYRGGILY